MEKHFIKYFALLLGASMAFQACNLIETQKSTADAAMVFGSETGLRSYCYSFYGFLPNGSSVHRQDEMADYLAKNELERYEQGFLTAENQSSWDWSDIRNVNYFLDHNHYESVPLNVRNNYNGIARFFRAMLYYKMLYWYGEVPWIDHVLNPGDPELLAPRDSRDVIIKHIMEDCDFAFEHILEEGSAGSEACLVNKWCAMLLKSRVCLFEASWRKYHAGTPYVAGCTIPADELFRNAADAAAIVMDGKVFSLHTGTPDNGGRGAYRDLFSSATVPTDEVMLAVASDPALSSPGYANYYYNVQASRASLTRPFMNTYLNADGTFYSETHADGTYKTFLEETTGRDYRMNQTIRAYDYSCKDVNGVMARTTANYGYSLTGYQVTKFCQDDVVYDTYGANSNDVPVMRYAEVLLNYAEAKAELGALTDDDWKKTIGALRRRAGITGGNLDTKPTEVDNYLKSTYFPGISNPEILEIRRERSIELCLEGFRMRDLKRWACGRLWATAPWTGVFITATNAPLDMNGDGTPDVYFTVGESTAPDEYAKIAVALPKNSSWISVPGGKVLSFNMTGRVWNDNMYLDPIANTDRTQNPNLSQNPGY